MRKLKCVTVLVFTLLMLYGASPVFAAEYTDYIGKSLGVVDGEVYGKLAEELGWSDDIRIYSMLGDMLEDISRGRLEVGVASSVIRNAIMAEGRYPDLDYLLLPKEIYVEKCSAVFKDAELRGKFNEWVKQAREDGILDEMENRWFGRKLPGPDEIPVIPNDGTGGTLVCATASGYAPLAYMGADNKVIGYEIEIAERFAAFCNMKIRFTDMAYGAILPTIQSGKADFSNLFTITDEREANILFGDSFIEFTACFIAKKAESAVKTYEDFIGKRFAVVTGTIYDRITNDLMQSRDTLYFSDPSSMFEAVKQGKADACMTETMLVKIICQKLGGLGGVNLPPDVYNTKLGAISENLELLDQFNAFIDQITEDGTLAGINSRWTDNYDYTNPPELPEFPEAGANGVLTVATQGMHEPFIFRYGDQYTGLEAELAVRFAASLGKTVKWEVMDFSGLIPYIVSGKADIALSNITITEERQRQVHFSKPYVTQYMGLIYHDENAAENGAKTYEDFIGTTIAVITGTVYDQIASDLMQSQGTLYFSDASSVIEAVKGGKADACILERMLAKIAGQKNDGLGYTDLPPDVYYMDIGAISENPELLDLFNVFLDQITKDGTLAVINSRWIDNYDYTNPPELPEFPEAGANGVLTVVADGTTEPYIFRSGDTYTGFDAELAVRFAASLGKTVKWEAMEFSGLIPYIVSGKADMALSSIAITEERQKQVHFSKPYTAVYLGLVYRDESAAESGAGFLSWLKNGVNNNLIQENRYKLILSGLSVTLKISVLSLICGTVVGSFVCYLLTRRNKFVKGFAKFYCGFIHGTPEVTLLMAAYYIVFGNSHIDGYLVAVAAFSLVCGAGVASSLGGAIDTVDKTEIEAARALGFPPVGAFMKVTLPQAVRRALPGYTEGFVGLVKSTAIVGYIAIQDLTRATDIIRSRTFDAYFPVILSALIYLVLTTFLIVILKCIVKKVNGRIPK